MGLAGWDHNKKSLRINNIINCQEFNPISSKQGAHWQSEFSAQYDTVCLFWLVGYNNRMQYLAHSNMAQSSLMMMMMLIESKVTGHVQENNTAVYYQVETDISAYLKVAMYSTPTHTRILQCKYRYTQSM